MSSSEIHAVRSDVELLKKDVSNSYSLLDKIDVAIDKISNATNDISKILTAHHTRLDQIEDYANEEKRMHEKNVDALHARISQKESELKDEMERNHKELMGFLRDHDNRSRESWKSISDRVETLERWKWYVVGMGTVVAVAFIQFAQKYISTIV